jgi:hypothetical protein
MGLTDLGMIWPCCLILLPATMKEKATNETNENETSTMKDQVTKAHFFERAKFRKYSSFDTLY